MGDKYVVSAIDNKTYCKVNGQFTKHLREHSLTYQDYHEIYILGYSPVCSFCGNSRTFNQSNYSYANSCGSASCRGKVISNSKLNWTEEQRLRDSNSKKEAAKRKTKEDLRIAREKRIQTSNERYGTDYTTQAEIMKSRSKETKKIRYGDEWYSNPKKTSDTWQAKNSSEIEEIVDKRRATCKDRYGVESLPSNLSGVGKSNNKYKTYTLPSGKEVLIRGYEQCVLDELLITYDENEFLIDGIEREFIPTFTYSNEITGRPSKYFPDIFLINENKLIEVKGRFWWDGNGDDKYKNRLINNMRKRLSVLSEGYEYEVWLFESKTNYRILSSDEDFAEFVCE